MVESTREKGEGGRKSVGVRNQGASCPQTKCFIVFRWTDEPKSRMCLEFLLSWCLKTCFHFGESLDTQFPVPTAASLYPSNYKVSTCFCRWDATVYIKVEGKRGKITSVAWFNCKQRVEGRVMPAYIACWFRILDKRRIKDFLMQDTLPPWPPRRRNTNIQCSPQQMIWQIWFSIDGSIFQLRHDLC